jgi:hypothetical protein
VLRPESTQLCVGTPSNVGYAVLEMKHVEQYLGLKLGILIHPASISVSMETRPTRYLSRYREHMRVGIRVTTEG